MPEALKAYRRRMTILHDGIYASVRTLVANSETVKPDAARPGSLVRRVE
jgi:hypothetical protein